MVAAAIIGAFLLPFVSGCAVGTTNTSGAPVVSGDPAPTDAENGDTSETPGIPTTAGAGPPDDTGSTEESAGGPIDELPPEQNPTLGPTRLYTDPDYGFSFVYPEGWKLTTTAGAETGPGGTSLKDVGAFDPTGSGVGGVLLDGFAVSVFQLNVVINADLLPALERELEDLLVGLRGRLSSVEVVEPLRSTSINGTQGFETTHTFSYKGRRLRSRVVFLTAGTFEYQLTTQATEPSWEVSTPTLDLLVDSFTPGG
ncbi:MAG: hypothetical protein ACYCX3_10545 [Thermoleophilia bacterium]